MILFHKTSAAAAPKILSGGFIDAEGSFGMVGLDEPLRGVWVSDLPLHAGNGMHDPEPYRQSWSQILEHHPNAIFYPTMPGGAPNGPDSTLEPASSGVQ